MIKKLLNMGMVMAMPFTLLAQSDFDCSTLNPIIENSEINICEPGNNVSLKAQSTNGNAVYWYDAEEAVRPIYKGTEFDAGFVSDSSSYWVSDIQYQQKELNAQAKPIYTSSFAIGFNFAAGVVFEAEQHFIIKSLEVFPTSPQAGVVARLKLMDEDDNVLDEINDIQIPAVEVIGSPDPVLLELNFEVPKPGTYKLLTESYEGVIMPALAVDLGHAGNEANFPHDVGEGAAKVVAGFQNDKVNENQYFYFYNWTVILDDVICESDRQEIKINVNDDYPDIPNIESEHILCGEEGSLTLADVFIEDTHFLQWYDDEGNDIDPETLVELGVTYLVADMSVGGCLSGFTDVTFDFQDISEAPVAELEQTFEEDSGADLTSLEVEGENLRWYADEDMTEELEEDMLLEDGKTYYVTQTLEDLCESEPIGIKVIETLSVLDFNFVDLRYTNPVQDMLYLANGQKIQNLSLFDATGKQLKASAKGLFTSEIELDMSILDSGIYFLSIQSNEGVKTIKLIKD